MAGSSYSLQLKAMVDVAGSGIQKQLDEFAGMFSIKVNAIIQQALNDANNVTPPAGTSSTMPTTPPTALATAPTTPPAKAKAKVRKTGGRP